MSVRLPDGRLPGEGASASSGRARNDQQRYPIKVVTWDDRSFTVNVLPGNTVKSLKRKLERHTGLLVERLEGQILHPKDFTVLSDDAKTLADYKFQRWDRLALVDKDVREAGVKTAQIFVVFLSGKGGNVEVPADGSVEDLKRAIFRREALLLSSQYRLISRGQELGAKGETLLPNYLFGKRGTVHIVMHLRGGCGIGFDFSSMEGAKTVKFASSAPSWRQIAPGLNLSGKCLNTACKADTIWVKKGFGTFRVAEELFKSKCPECQKNDVKLDNLGFWKCRFVVDGYDNDKNESVEKDVTVEEEDEFTTFNSGHSNWAYLNITTHELST